MTTDWRAIRRFVALDFETADHHPDSACAIGAVRIEDRGIVARFEALVRPPRRKVHFTFVHGLTWQQLERAAPFAGAWPRCAPLFDGVEAIVAHGHRSIALCCSPAAHTRRCVRRERRFCARANSLEGP